MTAPHCDNPHGCEVCAPESFEDLLAILAPLNPVEVTA